MLTHLSAAAATQTLSVDEQEQLISLIQLAPGTPDADAAFERLTTAFLPLLRKVAIEARGVDFEDAFSAALEAFVVHVRRHDLTAASFAGTIGPALRAGTFEASRQATTIAVRKSVAKHYWQLLRRHDGDIAAAYEECAQTPNGLAPSTFLAAHRAFQAVASLDMRLHLEAELHPVAPASETGLSAANAEMAHQLLELLPARQETVTRVAHGFTDLPTQTIVAASEYMPGTPLNDRETAAVVGLPTRTVNRERDRALTTMRAAVGSLIGDAA